MSDAGPRPRSYHVLVEVEGDAFLSRLHAMSVWLDQWKISFRVDSMPCDEDVIRVCFSEEKFARAFQRKFGARSAQADALAVTQAEDDARPEWRKRWRRV